MAVTGTAHGISPAPFTARERSAPGPPRACRARDLVALTKPRILAMAAVAALAGAVLAPGALSAARALAAVTGTCLLAGAACVLNMLLERESDARMRRTRDRPLAAGRVTAGEALALGATMAGIGAAILALWTTAAATLAGLASLALYAGAYTPLKRRTSLAFVVGLAPGAASPLIGWAAADGGLGGGGLALFALVCLWQIPHVIAVQGYLAEDYQRAGVRLVHDTIGLATARRLAIALTALLVPAGPAAVLAAGGGAPAAGVAGALGVWLFTTARAGLPPEAGAAGARRYFRATLAYLGLTFAALLCGAAL
jgi:protoheme IX farnesyltransferase